MTVSSEQDLQEREFWGETVELYEEQYIIRSTPKDIKPNILGSLRIFAPGRTKKFKLLVIEATGRL
jgi:hypothetical protein